jgi:gliding motility-associated-like protein
MKSILTNSKIRSNFYLFIFIFCFSWSFYGQSITPKILPFTSACAQLGSDKFYPSFQYSNFPSGTTFTIELSNEVGSFSNPIIPVQNISSDNGAVMTKEFSLPTNLICSSKYVIRVKSSTGVISEFELKDINDIGNPNATTKFFPACFKFFTKAFTINNNRDATICNSGSVTLSIDNPTPTIPDTSPVQVSTLRYVWFKNSIQILNETSSSLKVTAEGEYYVTLDYGACTTTASTSNKVSVKTNSGTNSANITTSIGNPFCEGRVNTLSASVSGNTYQWYIDGILIDGANRKDYQAEKEGLYSIDIDFGGCSVNPKPTIDLKGFKNGTTVDVSERNRYLPKETQTVTVTTNAKAPTFKWYLNDALIQNANTKSYTIKEKGKYKVVVNQTVDCLIQDEKTFSFYDYADVAEIPNIISPNGDGSNDTWLIPEIYLDGTNAEVVIYNSKGETLLQTKKYQNDFPTDKIEINNINPVYYYTITTADNSVKKGSITILK